MSTHTVTRTPTGGGHRAAREPGPSEARQSHAAVPFTRLLWVELTKMIDTRSGFWLLTSIGISALVATGAVIAFAAEEQQTYATFSAAVGMPIAIILPMIAILSVTSEWSQRTGLSTFTLVPHRSRVLAAKAAMAVTVGVASMLLALGIAALGQLLSTAVTGHEAVWDIGAGNFATILLANVLGLLMGFTLGVVFRNSAAAIVGYFVFSMVLPNLLFMLGTVRQWFADLQPWVDFYFSYTVLFEDVPTAEQWAQIGTSSLLWLVLPLAWGTWAAVRSEVK